MADRPWRPGQKRNGHAKALGPPTVVAPIAISFEPQATFARGWLGVTPDKLPAILAASLQACGKSSFSPERVAGAASGSSGQACFGYRRRSSFFTSGYVLRQKLARSLVTCCGR